VLREVWQLLPEVWARLGPLRLEDGCAGGLFPPPMQTEGWNIQYVAAPGKVKPKGFSGAGKYEGFPAPFT